LPEQLAADAALKLFVLTVIVGAVNVAWLLAGAVLTRFFRDPRSNRIINLAFALSLVGSVALAFAI
jgi:threonine/homoserine/homoserine lactone efflux protein